MRDRLTVLLLAYLSVLLVLGTLSSLAGWAPRTVERVWAVAANTGSVLYYSSLPCTIRKVGPHPHTAPAFAPAPTFTPGPASP